jgi:hypothetical protein
MAQTLKKLAQSQFGVADAIVYTTPAGTYTAITGIFICNTDTSDRTFRLHQVDAAGSSSATNAIFYDYPIATKRTFIPPVGIVLEPGQMLRGLASSAAVVSITVFGIERT